MGTPEHSIPGLKVQLSTAFRSTLLPGNGPSRSLQYRRGMCASARYERVRVAGAGGYRAWPAGQGISTPPVRARKKEHGV